MCNAGLIPHRRTCPCVWVLRARNHSHWLFCVGAGLHFPLVEQFPILSLPMSIVIMMCLAVGLFASIMFGTLCAFWTCMSIFLLSLGNFLLLFFQIDFQFLALSLLLWYPYDENVGTLEVVPEAPYTILMFLNYFFFLLFWLVVFCFLMF